MKLASPAFTHTLVQLNERILIVSACCICGASELVSRADGSLEEWEVRHSEQHEPAGVNQSELKIKLRHI